ncbi:MAG: hypothetical protein QXD95_06145 [Nitrososphaeria archaeon]
MVLEAKGRMYRRGNRVYVYIPTEISIDSAFPFKFEKGYVKVIIDVNNNRIIIENANNCERSKRFTE